MPQITITSLELLESKGIKFLIDIPQPYGGTSYIFPSPAEILEFLNDPDEVYARAHRVTKVQYRDWLDDSCSVYCAGVTKRGDRCKNFALQGFTVNARKWVELQGSYCAIHGGE